MRNTLSKGQLVFCNGSVGKILLFDRLQGVLVQDRNTNEQFYAAADDLKAVEDEHEADIAARMRELWFNDPRVKEHHRILASAREECILKYHNKALSRSAAAKDANLSIAQFARLLKRYNPKFGAVSILGLPRGRKIGATYLLERVEQITWFCIDKFYLGEAASANYVREQIVSYCAVEHLKPPSLGTVEARLNSLGKPELYLRKHGREKYNQKYGYKPGRKITIRALEHVQIDHTMVDIFILDDSRMPLMRPWITMLIDIHTRVVLGYYITLCPPSAISCAMALVHAVSPKNKMLAALGDDDLVYFCYGLMSVIHSDNASEFRSPIFESTCRAYGIDPKYRPLGKKHFGGHIERLIGTFMGFVHFQRGSTQSNVYKRGAIDPQKFATKTLAEFELWFARSVAIYHDTEHSALKGKSPNEAWIANFTSPNGIDIMPPTVADLRTFALDFFPSDHRTISPKGILFKWQFYQDNILRTMGRERVEFKYDPRDYSRIFLKDKGIYRDIVVADQSQENFSENQMILRDPAVIANPGKVKDDRAHRLRIKNNELDDSTRKETKRQRIKRNADAAHGKKIDEIIGTIESQQVSEDLNAPTIPQVKPIDQNRARRKLRWEE